MTRGCLLALLALAAGCDSKATASDSAPRPEPKPSREYESCGTSAHCADDLRCFDQTCRRAVRSTVGDYYAALGARHRANGELDAAIASYAAALGHYDSEKLPLPPDLDCAYGAALAAAKSNKDRAELGARVLHRCALAVGAASPLRAAALATLATLDDAGLDPALLGGTPADRYLTLGPKQPATDKLTVTVTAAPPPAKSMAAISDALTAQRAALIGCWESYNSAANKDAMTVTIGVKNSYAAADYDDEAGSWTMKLEPATATVGPDAAADACVRQILEPALKGAKLQEAFSAKITVAVR